MANAVVPWDQRPAYLAFTDWTPIPGVTSHVVPHNGTGTNVTQFHPGHAFLSEYNLPDVMYQLHPCDEWERFKKTPPPGPKHNPDGTLVYEQWTRPGQERRPLLDFKILPDKISTEEAWWYHEFLRRMDPRIRQLDIIMREEFSVERLRMEDPRYVNIHLNTPGYRTYRPAWKMIAWHVKGNSAKQNDRKEWVLERLSDAQKQANTTRGSTPGLINPALGDVIGNRVALPVLTIMKRGPKRPKKKTNNTPATQPAQAPQPPQPTRARRKRRAREAPQIPEAAQGAQGAQGDNPSAWSVPFPAVSATMGTPSQNFAVEAAAPELNDLRGFQNAQARDAAAMPPPPLPFINANGQLSHHQMCIPDPDSQCFANGPPDFENTQADFWEVEDFTATNPFVSKPGSQPDFPFTSGEEIAGISTKSDEVMAEIYRICEPFLDPDSELQGPPPMDLSAELTNEMGLDVMFPTQTGVEVRRKGNGNARPNPAQTMPAQTLAEQNTPMLRKKQGTKRKERDNSNENFQNIQLDVEKQERRPTKQVKSVHHANFQNNNGSLYHDAAYNFQQQQHFGPKYGYYQSEIPQEQALGGPALQGGKYSSVDDADQYTGGGRFEEQTRGTIGQHLNQNTEPTHHHIYPAAPLRETFPDRQLSVDSPYQPVPTARAQSSNLQTLNIQSHGLEEYFSQGNMQPSQTMRRPSPMSSPMPNAQPPSSQIPANRPKSRADRGHDREALGQTSNNYRYHPYANSRKGNGHRMEAPQAHQINNENQLQPTGTPVAQGGEDYHPEMTPGPLEHVPLQNTLSDAPLDPNVEGVFIYKNSDPAQGLDVEATRKFRDWLSQG